MPSAAERLPRRKETEIAELAEYISVSNYGGNRVHPEEIAAKEGIVFDYAAFAEDFDGILLHDRGDFFIVCNERRGLRGSTRSRFTFAHELGHYFLDEHRRALSSGKLPAHFSLAEFISNQPIEIEADHFAANFLMPASPFRAKATDLDPGINLICSLASHFGTSVTSTAYRALELDVFPAPCAVYRWDSSGRLNSRRMSPTSFAMYPGYRGMIDTPPSASGTAHAVAREGSGILRRSSDCSQWFSFISPAEPRNVVLQEEVMPLGQFGWITLVYRAV